MSRREFLKRIGLLGGVGATSAIAYRIATDPKRDRTPETRPPVDRPESTATPSGTITRDRVDYASTFDRVVDMAEMGVDPEGGAINDIVTSYADDDTLLSFPPATYRIRPMNLSGLSNFGIASAFDDRVTFVPTAGDCEPREPFLRFRDVEGFLMDGVNFDFTNTSTGAKLQVYASGDATIRNVDLAGSCPGQIAMLRIDIKEEHGHGLVEKLTARNIEENPTLTGVYVGEPHAGELTFRDCDLRGFGDNGLYASSPGLEDGGMDGPVNVIGGTYMNSNISNVRLGSTGSTAKGVTVVVNRIPPFDDGVNARGIRLRENLDQTIDDCVIRLGKRAGSSFGAIVFHPENGGALVKDTTIQVDKDTVPGIRAFPAAAKFDNVQSSPVFENVTITGSASEGYAANILGRDGTIFRNCTIKQQGNIRGGINLDHSSDCELINCHIETTYTPLTLNDSTIRIRDTTFVGPNGTTYITDETTDNDELLAV